MSKPELQEIPEDASIKLVLTIASNNQRALVKYIDYLEKELRKPRKRLQAGKWDPTAYNY